MLGKNIDIRDLTSSELIILKNKTREIDNLIKVYKKINQLPWKFKVITKNIGAYWTYDDYIYIYSSK